MKKKEQKIEYEIKWWKDWLESDAIKRIKMVEKLPLVKELPNFAKLPPKLMQKSFVSQLNGFFEDLKSAVYTKAAIDSS